MKLGSNSLDDAWADSNRQGNAVTVLEEARSCV